MSSPLALSCLLAGLPAALALDKVQYHLPLNTSGFTVQGLRR